MDQFVRNGETLFSEVGDDIVALDVTRGECFGMNEVASDVWRMLEMPMSLDGLCRQLCERYDVDPETCQHDISALIETMVAKTLVRRATLS